jgi:hypothetical protein
MATRLQAMGQSKYQNGFKVTTHPEVLDEPLSYVKKNVMCFVCSMSDLFHVDVPFEFIDEVFKRIIARPDITFQVLTKRSERMAEYFSTRTVPANCWIGVTCGCKSSIYRLNDLRKIEAPETLEGETLISITSDKVTLQLSTPYQSGFPAKFTCTAEKLLLKDISITTLVEYYGSTAYEFPVLSIRENSNGFLMLEEYARENSDPRRVFKDPVCGWNSWDYYTWTVTEDDVLENARFIANDPVLSKHVKRIIIDDGWQHCYGEW